MTASRSTTPTSRPTRFLACVAAAALIAACSDGKANDTTDTVAHGLADVPAGSGPTVVTGNVEYTNTFFTAGVAEPVIILEDQTGFVTRDRNFVFPQESQVIGQITSPFEVSPFSYSVTLPAKPAGTLNDVDHDGSNDAGVMVYAVAYWTNTWGDPFLEERDQGGGGWSSAYASTRVTDAADAYLEVTGGKYLVYAPDGDQQFPSAFGEDAKLFTDDDPLMDLAAGWSVVDMDESPFTVDRSAEATVDLVEPESAALDDFSGMSYTEAFDAMLEKFTNEYAFTDLKGIDWEAKGAEFRPQFEAAETAEDPHAYALAVRDFIWSIPDSHVSFQTTALDGDFDQETAGGLGLAITETDDGQIVVSYLLEGGPAASAGIALGAQIVSFDGTPIGELVDASVPWSSPFSNAEIGRLQQLRYAIRFPADHAPVAVAFVNPDGTEQTATLTVVAERDSFSASSFYAGQSPAALPVEYDLLPSGNGYIKINSFLDNDLLSIQVFERALHFFNDNAVPGIVIDMRINGGGSGWLADQMAAYFFTDRVVVGNTARFNQASGEFYIDEGDQQEMIPPPETDGVRFSGPVTLLVGPGCASACEFFSYNMTLNDRATIVGEYSTNGAGGSVEQFLMPEAMTIQMTIGRAVDTDGEIHLEGTGVVPTIDVPVTVDNILRKANGEDVVLEAAEELGLAPAGAGVEASGPPTIASSADAQTALEAGTTFLESSAPETPDASEYAQPGTISYTPSLSASEPAIWAYTWCAGDAETLVTNFESIELAFVLDGTDVTDQATPFDDDSSGIFCRYLFFALSDWPVGEHHLVTTATFTATINDGTDDYSAGDYVLDYVVTAS